MLNKHEEITDENAQYFELTVYWLVSICIEYSLIHSYKQNIISYYLLFKKILDDQENFAV